MNISAIFARLKRYRARDYLYFITPPILAKVFSKLSNLKSSDSRDVSSKDFEDELKNLEDKGLNYFMDDDVVQVFCRKTREHFIENKILPLEGNDNDYLNKLNNDGYVVVKNIIDKDSLNLFKEKLDPVINNEIEALEDYRKNAPSLLTSKAPTRNVDGLRSVHNISDGVIRVWNIDAFLPELKEKIDNSCIFRICNAYLSGKAGPSNIYMDIKPIPDAFDSSVAPHADSPFRICKVFIALEDVTLDNAPFLYFKGSHKPNHFRLLKDLLAFSGHNKKFYDEFNSYNYMGMLKLTEDNYESFSPEIVPLNAGDAIITDTRGVHAATNLKKGRRVQIGQVYSDRNFDIDINERDPLIRGLVKDTA